MKFTKMHGTGNDFIIIDTIDFVNRITEREGSRLAIKLCHRRFGIGADGMMLVCPAEENGDCRMVFYNSDGTIGEMCGNGARCLARYLYEEKRAGSSQKIETKAGLVEGKRISQTQYQVKLNNPTVMNVNFVAETKNGPILCSYIELGNPGIPHISILRPDLIGAWQTDRETLRQLAEALRSSDSCPKGANVNLYEKMGDNRLEVRTYERGVEDFTLSCGTGSAAVALTVLVDLIKKEAELPPLQVNVPGGELLLTVCRNGKDISGIFLEGPAMLVARGESFEV